MGKTQEKRTRKTKTGFDIGADVIRAQLRTMPTSAGVYRMLAEDGSVLYVGKAKNLKNRVTSYTQRARLSVRIQRMVAQTRNMEIVVTSSETEAFLLEANLIQHFSPPYNIIFRDDKSYPYILITRDHDFPALAKHRGSQSRKGWYFGPFASNSAVNETLNQLQRGFLLRNCSDGFFSTRSRPCLQYHIKRCTAPCTKLVTKDAYAEQVKEALDFLRGHSQDIQQKLAAAMQEASDAQQYEKAAVLRDRIRALTQIQSRQDIFVAHLGDADVIALYQDAGSVAVQVFFFRADRNYGTRAFFPTHAAQEKPAEIMAAFLAQFYAERPIPPSLLLNLAPENAEVFEKLFTEKAGNKISLIVPKMGEKKRLVTHALQNAKTALHRKLAENAEQTHLLVRVAEVFHLQEAPRRIEVYDNSHTSGSFAVGAMIAAGAEGFLKKTYRKFNIRQAATNDDFAMMREVLTRRFKRLMEEDPTRASGLWPDLLLIDGGQGQIGKVRDVLEEMGLADIALVGIAKGPDRNAGRERFFIPGREPFSLPHDDPTLYYLQRLRDEAHRFAIGTHRARRTKAIGQSGLEDIPGIGSVRKRALLHHFGSARAVQEARLDDLTRVPGISRDVAKKIHDYFKS